MASKSSTTNQVSSLFYRTAAARLCVGWDDYMKYERHVQSIPTGCWCCAFETNNSLGEPRIRFFYSDFADSHS